MIKILSWNILQGGGNRVSDISTAIIHSGAQIICLNEFKNNDAGTKLRYNLLKAGYFHQFVGPADSNTNSVLTASKLPFSASTISKNDSQFPQSIIKTDFDIFSVFNMYLPHKKKHQLFDLIIQEMSTNQTGIFVGDFNSGKQFIDQQGDSFMYSEYFDKMEALSYVDAWRFIHADSKEYSWFSHQGNGYRYDHNYIHENLVPVVKSCDYLHDWRLRKLSDHSPMLLELGN